MDHSIWAHTHLSGWHCSAMRLYADLMSASDAPCCNPSSLYGSMSIKLFKVYKVAMNLGKEREQARGLGLWPGTEDLH